jgi:hypothetical protein
MNYNNIYIALSSVYEHIVYSLKNNKNVTIYVNKKLYDELSYLNIDSRVNIILDNDITLIMKRVLQK